MEYDIEKILQTYEDDYNPDPRPMDQEPRNMYSQGQLVSNTVDGSRPGYNGENDFGKTVESNIRLRSGKYDVSYKGNSLGSFDKITDARKAINKAKEDNPRQKTGSVKKGSRGDILRKNLDKLFKSNNTSPSFEEVTKNLSFKDDYDKRKYKKVLNTILENDEKYSSFKINTADRLTELEQKIVTDNFELPPGQKEWNFKNQKFGININENPNLTERIKRKIDGPQKYTIAADSAKPSGWMMNAMNRLYKNEIKKGVKPKDLTYKPIKKNGIIIGFTDTTAGGGNKTYYGLKKNTPEDATPWSGHGDYGRIQKFLKIAKGAQIDDPSKLLQKILDDKGITKLMGDKSVLKLNDILSHERYYKNISDIVPKKLLEKQIVLHHAGGVGAGTNIARAAATKDIQLLTGAVNDNVKNIERIVRGTNKTPARKLNAGEIAQLKNFGAKITDFDGKVVGGGYIDPTKQFAGIEKKALEYAKGNQFNVKTVASYLERLGCGRAAGGRILFAEGVPGLTKCGKAGVAKIEKGLANGFKKSDVGLAQKILGSGKFLKDAVSLRGLLGPAALAFTAAAEAGIVGYDMLSTGKSFKEAVGSSVFNYMLGDKTKINEVEERDKRMVAEGMTPEQMGKIKYMESMMGDMQQGFDLDKQLNAITKNRKQIGNNPEDTFNEGAFQLDLDKQEDKVRADIQDYNRVNKVGELENYFSPKEDGTVPFLGGMQTLTEGLRRNELAQLQSVNNPLQSRRGDEKRSARKQELMLKNPDVKNYMGPYPTNYGFNEGGLAGLMKKYYD